MEGTRVDRPLGWLWDLGTPTSSLRVWLLVVAYFSSFIHKNTHEDIKV